MEKADDIIKAEKKKADDIIKVETSFNEDVPSASGFNGFRASVLSIVNLQLHYA